MLQVIITQPNITPTKQNQPPSLQKKYSKTFHSLSKPQNMALRHFKIKPSSVQVLFLALRTFLAITAVRGVHMVKRADERTRRGKDAIVQRTPLKKKRPGSPQQKRQLFRDHCGNYGHAQSNSWSIINEENNGDRNG